METTHLRTPGLGLLTAAAVAALVLSSASAPASAKVTAPGTALAGVTATLQSKVTRPAVTPVKQTVIVAFDGPAAVNGNGPSANSYRLGFANDTPKLAPVLTAKYVYVNTDPKVSKQQTVFSGSGKRRSTFTVRVTAPKWQATAKVRVYFKARGKSSYRLVRTSYLKSITSGGTTLAKRTIKVSKKYNLAGKGGRYYLKISSVIGAPGYSTSSKAIARR